MLCTGDKELEGLHFKILKAPNDETKNDPSLQSAHETVNRLADVFETIDQGYLRKLELGIYSGKRWVNCGGAAATAGPPSVVPDQTKGAFTLTSLCRPVPPGWQIQPARRTLWSNRTCSD